jgi:ankyrin repeat protein
LAIKYFDYPFIRYAGRFLGEHLRKAHEIQKAHPNSPEISTQFHNILQRVHKLLNERPKWRFYRWLLKELSRYFEYSHLDYLFQTLQMGENDTISYGYNSSVQSSVGEYPSFGKSDSNYAADEALLSLSANEINVLEGSDHFNWSSTLSRSGQPTRCRSPSPQRRVSDTSDNDDKLQTDDHTEYGYISDNDDILDMDDLPDYGKGYVGDVPLEQFPRISPLHVACFLGSPTLVQSVLATEKSTNVNKLDSYNQSPLMIAVKRGFADVVWVLLEHGANVDLESQFGHCFLLHAAQQRTPEIVETILARAIFIARRNDISPPRKTLSKTFRTHNSVGLIELTGWLVFWSVAISLLYVLCLDATETMFIIDQAVLWVKVEIADVAIDEHFVDPNTYHSSRRVPIPRHYVELLFAAHCCTTTKIPALLDLCDEALPFHDMFVKTAFFLAIKRGHIAIVSIILEHGGIDIDMPDHPLRTPLHQAACLGFASIVELLLEKGARVDARAVNQDTAWSATFNGSGLEKTPSMSDAASQSSAMLTNNW